MARGINNNAWRVTSAARSLANSADDILGFSVPEEGPLSHADEYMPDFMELLAKGVKDSKRMLLNTIRDLAGTVGTAFTRLSLPEIIINNTSVLLTTTNENRCIFTVRGRT